MGSIMKKTRGQKPRATVPLIQVLTSHDPTHDQAELETCYTSALLARYNTNNYARRQSKEWWYWIMILQLRLWLHRTSSMCLLWLSRDVAAYLRCDFPLIMPMRDVVACWTCVFLLKMRAILEMWWFTDYVLAY
jgi:hypothetical protein